MRKTFIYGTIKGDWGFLLPYEFFPDLRNAPRKQYNRALRSRVFEHHTRHVWHKVWRRYTREGLIFIDGIGWRTKEVAEAYRAILNRTP